MVPLRIFVTPYAGRMALFQGAALGGSTRVSDRGNFNDSRGVKVLSLLAIAVIVVVIAVTTGVWRSMQYRGVVSTQHPPQFTHKAGPDLTEPETSTMNRAATTMNRAVNESAAEPEEHGYSSDPTNMVPQAVFAAVFEGVGILLFLSLIWGGCWTAYCRS